MIRVAFVSHTGDGQTFFETTLVVGDVLAWKASFAEERSENLFWFDAGQWWMCNRMRGTGRIATRSGEIIKVSETCYPEGSPLSLSDVIRGAIKSDSVSLFFKSDEETTSQSRKIVCGAEGRAPAPPGSSTPRGELTE